jgi:hypothetical protein
MAAVALVLQQRMIEPDNGSEANVAGAGMRSPEKNPLKLLKLMNPLMKGLLATDILVRFCEQIPYAFVKALIMDLSPDSCKAGMFGLYYLIRDVCVAIAALGGAFLWQISPPTNLVTAFFFGLIGTVGFWIVGRDIQVPANKEESMGE